MSGRLFVSTLVAPQGAVLLPQQIQSVAQSIEQNGGKVEKHVVIDSRAADIFFVADLGDSKSERNPLLRLAGRVREGEATQEQSQKNSKDSTFNLAQQISASSLRRPPLPNPPRGGEGISFDIITQAAESRRKKILVADMESTIIGQEMLDEMAVMLGIGAQVAEITRRAMNGELDFTAALTERVGLLKGQPASLLDHAASRMTFNPGAIELVAAMKNSGGKAWLVSGGFTCFVRKIAEHAGFNEFFANNLLVEAGFLTGEVELPVLDKNSKKGLLEKACATYGYDLADSITVGDGANDVPMLEASNARGGLGVAYRAKPKVREIIPHQINHSDLSVLVYAMGFSEKMDREIPLDT